MESFLRLHEENHKITQCQWLKCRLQPHQIFNRFKVSNNPKNAVSLSFKNRRWCRKELENGKCFSFVHHRNNLTFIHTTMDISIVFTGVLFELGCIIIIALSTLLFVFVSDFLFHRLATGKTTQSPHPHI